MFYFQRVEREIQQKLEEKEESAVELQETYVSLQQEVEVKTKKLKKVSHSPRQRRVIESFSICLQENLCFEYSLELLHLKVQLC